MHPQSCARGLAGRRKERFERVPRTLKKAKLSTNSANFSPPVTNNGIVSASESLGGSQGRKKECTSSALGFLLGVCPSSWQGNYCNCHFFCSFSSKEENGKSFLRPHHPTSPAPRLLGSPRCPLRRIPASHSVNCVHFNYDLISEERSAGRGGLRVGWGALLVPWHAPPCECCCDWIVSRGHDPSTGCHWASRVPTQTRALAPVQ